MEVEEIFPVEFAIPQEEDFGSSPLKIYTVQTNPLLMDQILERIFYFCDELTLQEVRQVNYQWDNEGTKELLRNVYICCPVDFHRTLCTLEQEEMRNALKTLLSYRYPIDLLALRITDFRDTQVYHELKILNEKIRVLAYGQKDGRSLDNSVGMNTQHLARVLSKLPNLDVLETNCLDLDPNQSWLHPDNPNSSINASADPNPDLNPVPIPDVETPLEQLLTKLESLKEIHLNFWLSAENLVHYFPHRKRMESVRSLKINRETVFTLYNNFGFAWKIQRMRMMINSEISTEWTRHFLRSMSECLEHLRLSFFFRRAKVHNSTEDEEQQQVERDQFAGDNPSIPDISNAHIPWSLSQLKTLDIYEDDPRLEFTVWKTIVAALQLPRLKKLTIRASITIYFDEIARQFELQRNRPLRSESLEKLQLWPTSFSSSTLLFSNCFPRLKSLLIKLDLNQIATMTAMYAIFSDLCKLERLELFLKDDHSSDHEWNRRRLRSSKENFDELLTGVKRPDNYTTGRIEDWTFIDSLEFNEFRSIRNLKQLKVLKIESTTCKKHAWTDFTIYHGLIYLKKLQSLELTKKFISDKAIEDLKIALGYNVNIYCYPEI